MTVTIPRKARRIASAVLLTGAFTAGYVAVGAGIASATDASATVNVKCVKPSESLWSATVTFTNQWDGETTVTLDASLAAFHASHTFTGNGATWTPSTFITSDASISFMASSNHPEHFHNSVPSLVSRPAGCVPPATSEPGTTTTTTCSMAIPPRGDCGGATTVPTIPPTTVAVCHPGPGEPGFDQCGDCSTPEVCAAYQATTTTTTGAPAAVTVTPTVKKAVATTVAPTLPTTGGSDVKPLVAAALALLLGAFLVLFTRRPAR